MDRLREGCGHPKGYPASIPIDSISLTESPYVQFSFTEQLQNLRTVLMYTDGYVPIYTGAA